MSNKLYNAHDRFVRRNLSHLETVRALFRRVLDPALQETLALDRLSDAKESYVGERLDSLITAMLFSVPFKDHPAFLALLVELKPKL